MKQGKLLRKLIQRKNPSFIMRKQKKNTRKFGWTLKKKVKGIRKESCKENLQTEEIIEIFCRKIFRNKKG